MYLFNSFMLDINTACMHSLKRKITDLKHRLFALVISHDYCHEMQVGADNITG